jgi:hypothetical protein
LGSIRFGLLIALLFFTCWSGCMFCMALTLQSGMGMAPWQSGNSFIAMGISYFVSAWFAPRLIVRHSLSTILLSGIAIQVVGLLGLIFTLWHFGTHAGPLAIAPATLVVGYGQALIVNSFYRIGMRDIDLNDAGAASAILSTLQQSALGLGPAVLGALFLHLQHQSGDYSVAMIGFLAAEIVMMLALAVAAVTRRQLLSGVKVSLR